MCDMPRVVAHEQAAVQQSGHTVRLTMTVLLESKGYRTPQGLAGHSFMQGPSSTAEHLPLWLHSSRAGTALGRV